MGVRIPTPRPDVRSVVREQMAAFRASLIEHLSEVGELCVEDAREKGSYTDRTGNLRSSVGYVVAENGVVVASSSFASVLGATEGPVEGRALAERVASQQREGLTLILVAGMKYATYVADKGFNVLDSAEILAERLVSQLSI